MKRWFLRKWRMKLNKRLTMLSVRINGNYITKWCVSTVMAKRKQRPFHVVYQKDPGIWRVKKEKGRFQTKNGYRLKSDATAKAKREAKRQGVGIVVHKKDNTTHYGFTAKRILELHNKKVP